MKTPSLKFEFNYSVTEERNQHGPYLSVRLTPASEDAIKVFGADFVGTRNMLKRFDPEIMMSLWAAWLCDLAVHARGANPSRTVTFISAAGERIEAEAAVFTPH